MTLLARSLLYATVLLIASQPASIASAASGWIRHTIDAGSRGADGVRLGDVNRDGRTDIVTGWEEGGQIRIAFQPKQKHIREPWPSIVIAHVAAPEDAVFADLNGDGWLDVVSCCEGKERSVYFHLSPGDDRVTTGAEWTTQKMDATAGATAWMFCEPFPNAREGYSPRLCVGSKQPNGRIAFLEHGDRDSWTLKPGRPAGWIMSLRRWDIDGNGHNDLLYSDRKGDLRGVGWLRSRPDLSGRAWQDVQISDRMHEYMFLDVIRTDDGIPLIVVQTRNSGIMMYRPVSRLTDRWNQRVVTIDPRTGTGKGVAIGDVDLDGELDLVASCENAKNKIGVYWLKSAVRSTTDRDLSPQPSSPPLYDISGTESGVKFDRIELVDIDNDGDLDVLTCEERDNLGVIWYENPVKQ